MGIKFGEIDAGQIVSNEFKINRLEKIFDWLIQNGALAKSPPKEVLDQISESVVKELQAKYPKSGVKLEKGT